MNPASKALRLPLRASRKQPWTRFQTQPIRCASAATLPTRSQQYQLALPHPLSTAFSTRAIRMERVSAKTHPEVEQDAGLGSKPGWTPLAMSFESLGIGKNMKMLVILIASVTASLELFIWCEYIWEWWKGEEGDQV